jgi:hypothetical protein
MSCASVTCVWQPPCARVVVDGLFQIASTTHTSLNLEHLHLWLIHHPKHLPRQAAGLLSTKIVTVPNEYGEQRLLCILYTFVYAIPDISWNYVIKRRGWALFFAGAERETGPVIA